MTICDSGVPGCTCTVVDATGKTVATDVPSLACFAPIVVNVISLAFAFLGAVTLLFLLYGAIRFVTSRGDPKAIESAQKTMTYAVVGAAVVLASFIIVNLVTTTLGLGNILTNFTIYRQ